MIQRSPFARRIPHPTAPLLQVQAADVEESGTAPKNEEKGKDDELPTKDNAAADRKN